MKFSKEFVDVLKIFSGINQHMYFRQGKVQTSAVMTKAGSTVFFARAKTETEIEKDFGVISLGSFINVLKLFENPEITMTETNSIIVSEGGKKVNFKLTNPEFLDYSKEPDKIQAGVGISAELTDAQVVDILQMYGIFDAKYVSFIGKDGNFIVEVHSGEGSKFSNHGSIVLGPTDQIFNATITANLFHLPRKNYKVLVNRKGFVYFSDDTFEYFIPVNANYSLLR